MLLLLLLLIGKGLLNQFVELQLLLLDNRLPNQQLSTGFVQLSLDPSLLLFHLVLPVFQLFRDHQNGLFNKHLVFHIGLNERIGT